LVQFNPQVGAEIAKVRPAAVISRDEIGRLPLRVVVPITEWQRHFAQASWFVFLPATAENGLSKDSGADAFQVKSVSEQRFVRRLGTLTESQLSAAVSAIQLVIGGSPPSPPAPPSSAPTE
jgi:mRNA interferase MazF